MKITVLLENTRCRESLCCEHGLSLFIESGGKRILFDAGQSRFFADNARSLGIDLKAVDFAVLSHGHYDHGGGLGTFLEINPTAPIYLRREALGAQHNAQGAYIGLNRALTGEPRLRFCQGEPEIAPGMKLYPAVPARESVDSGGLTVLEEDILQPDAFLHEQYLLIEEGGKRILFSGCSHRGIRNIVDHFRPDVLIGGFHLVKWELGPRLEQLARDLAETETVFYTGHCTGERQYAFLKNYLGERLHPLSTGTTIEI